MLLGKKGWQLMLAASVSLGFNTSAEAAPAMVVENGQPRAEIVIAGQPARMTRLAASELQTYIEKISGAVLPIVTEPTAGAARIYVGISPHTEELGLETEGLKYGAYRMASGPDWLALLGPDEDFEPIEPYGHSRTSGSGGRAERDRVNRAWDGITGDHFWNPLHSLYAWYRPELDVWEFDDRGTLHAVQAFLHEQGVRWYAPGPLGEVVPKRSSIALPAVDRVVRPDFPVRRLSWFYQVAPISEDDARWRLRLGLHKGHDVIGITQAVHGMKYVLMREEMKEAHPEFYALWDGERATGHRGGQGAPCLSSEGLFAKHVAYARAVFDHFDEPMISIDMVDGYSRGVCGCERCHDQATPERGWGGQMSDYVWGYINRVAEALYESHPDRMVSGITYGTYTLPPEKIDRMSPNLTVILIPPRLSTDAGRWAELEGQMEAWRAKLPSGRIYTFGNILYNWGRLTPVYFPRQIARNLRFLKGRSLGEQIECYEHPPGSDYNWDAMAIPHVDLYVTSRFWWDADQDIEAMMEEYYTLYYGPAREEMKAFIEYCEVNWQDMVSTPGRGGGRVEGARGDAERIDRALALLEAAQAVAPAESVFGRRIAAVDVYLEPLRDFRAQLARAREDVPRMRLLPWGPLAHKSLDGRLDDDAFWRGNVLRMPMWDLVKGPPHRGTGGAENRFQIFWAGGALVFGIRCGEPDMENLNFGEEQDGVRDIRTGDFVEILIETSTHSYYRITVNPAGEIEDADCSDGVETRWTSGAQAVVHRGEDYWSVEVRVPLAGDDARLMNALAGVDGRLPSQNFPWYFNVGRQRVRDGEVERLAYSPTGTGEFEVLERFAELWGSTDLR